jgi:arsenate reductase-like glutaredoxin family protein
LFRETPSYKELQKILELTTDSMDEIRSQTYKDLNLKIDDLPLSGVIKLII